MNSQSPSSCPFCCSDLPAGAVKCRWCAEFVVADPRVSTDNVRGLLRRLQDAVKAVEDELSRRELEQRRQEEELRRRKTNLTLRGQETPVHVGMTLADAERVLVMATLETVGGKRGEAASILGVGERTIYRKLEEWGVTDETM